MRNAIRKDRRGDERQKTTLEFDDRHRKYSQQQTFLDIEMFGGGDWKLDAGRPGIA
jgi:hypothetical protein